MRKRGQLRHLAVVERDLSSPGVEDDHENTSGQRSCDSRGQLRAPGAAAVRGRSRDHHLRQLTLGGNAIERLDDEQRKKDGRNEREILRGTRFSGAGSDRSDSVSGVHRSHRESVPPKSVLRLFDRVVLTRRYSWLLAANQLE
jgi:hypothetical protein